MKLFGDMKPPSIDEIPLKFGKHKGMTPNEIAKVDPHWIVWAYDTINPKICTKELALSCEECEQDNFNDGFHDDAIIFHD